MKLFISLTKHHTMNMYWEWRYLITWQRWVACFTPWPLYPQGKSLPNTHWTEGWVGPRAGL